MEKLIVDQDCCVGCGMCLDTANMVFDMDDSNLAYVFKQPTEDVLDLVEEAIDDCPGSAIQWVEED